MRRRHHHESKNCVGAIVVTIAVVVIVAIATYVGVKTFGSHKTVTIDLQHEAEKVVNDGWIEKVYEETFKIKGEDRTITSYIVLHDGLQYLVQFEGQECITFCNYVGNKRT